LMAQTGLQAAILNVRINLTSIKDSVYALKISNELHELLQNAMEKSSEILGIVEKNL